ncbi:MAG: GNAT family N-acetyltransferase [Candidatus Heimdallarchaeota archaeon]
MKITEIDDTSKNQLWAIIGKNKADFFFEIREFEYNFSDTRFWIAQKKGIIVGTMFFDKAKTLRIFGPNEVVSRFLEFIDFTPRYLSVPDTFLELIPNFVNSEKRRLFMNRLVMQKTNIELRKRFVFDHLNKDDLKNALTIFQAAEPDDWSSSEADKLPYDAINQWYGLKGNDQFVSVCWNQIYQHGGHIAFIATHPNHQNKGYASALITFTLNETFQTNDFAIIHVRMDNEPALHIYRKMGYKDHLSYIVLCEPELK